MTEDQRIWVAAAKLIDANPEDHGDDEEIQPVFDALKTIKRDGVNPSNFQALMDSSPLIVDDRTQQEKQTDALMSRLFDKWI